MASPLNSFEEPKYRKLTYNFEDLEAIIFGMRTSIEDKIRIIKIIEDKCKFYGRDDFEFYQASYSSELGEMLINRIHIL
ncbi:hypothetical protein [Natranaerobius thermophilus]|uniref:hypothetical protein n=1 Tax=Natranaerobius thermophilus TaxID=375929 RepID=UPI00130D53D4|nr:hypothetical protein [Natranaerobius thermophilus]